MNWYYQKHIGLEMGFFWRRNIPVALTSAAVLIVFLAVEQFIPVSGWLEFFVWGVAYSIAFVWAMWSFVMNNEEKTIVAAKVPFLR